MSQIECGTALPSHEVIAWLAGRLGVDQSYLETGVTADQREQAEGALESLAAHLSEHRYVEALEELETVRASQILDNAGTAAQLRATFGEVWALVRLGRLAHADDALSRARTLVEDGRASTLEQAELHYLSAVRCYLGSEISAARVSFAQSLALLDGAEDANDRLRCDVHQWRSRCYRRERDWEAAQEDIDRALELCQALGDARRSAEVNLQASLLAERQGRWLLARRHAQVSLDLFVELEDEVTVGRVLNNLGGLNHLLGNDDLAVEQLRQAFAIFVDAHLEAEAGYVMGSLAETHRSQGRVAEAEKCARQSLALLTDRADHVQEIGTTQLVLARTHLDQRELDAAEDMLAAADRSYLHNGSISHQARSWVVRGDLAALRDDAAEAARLYRQAALALQPVDLALPS